jgi:glutamate-5-semialdehyde dehydrogenase
MNLKNDYSGCLLSKSYSGKRREDMSGDHRKTAEHEKELLINAGFEQIENTTLYRQGNLYLLSPAVKENQNGTYLFDVREAILSRYHNDSANETKRLLIFIRIVKDRFIPLQFSELEKIMRNFYDTESTGKKVWRFEIKDEFTVIMNRKNTSETLSVKALGKDEAACVLSNWKIDQLVTAMAKKGRKAARKLAALSTSVKNDILLATAEQLRAEREFIRAENEKDLAAGREKGLPPAMLDRLELSDKVIASMIQGLEEIAALPDPVGEVDDMKRRPSGITVGRMRVPLGVVGMIYESRPNVTIDAAALCLKAGNGVLLRGGSEAIHSNLALAGLLQKVLEAHAVPKEAVQVIPVTDRYGVNAMLAQEAFVDVIIPRGGEGLIRFVTENSSIPVLKHYKGVCHLYIDESGDIAAGIRIAMNGKTQRPGVCNALEGMLVHKAVADRFLPAVAKKLIAAGVELLGCERSCALVPEIKPAADSDWGTEFLELKMVVKVVDDMDAAMAYIAQYGSQHTEVIVTESYANSQRFLREVDASAVMINASSRFNDGGQFGLGAEIGISTTKLHAYGPMGLEELTTKKFIVYGQGEVRQ